MQVVSFMARLHLAIGTNVVVHLEHACVNRRGKLRHELGRHHILHAMRVPSERTHS